MPPPSSAHSLRWLVIGVFLPLSILNYLDRQLLAAVAPLLKEEYQLSNVQYGELIAAFSLVYALATPLAGLFVDAVGLRIGSVLAVVIWSVAGAATAVTQSFRGLWLTRMALAVGESAGIPAATKASATYLHPREIGLGTALQSVGISLGSMAAPLLVAAIAPTYGWRAAFLLSGGLGLVWAPIWWFTASRIPMPADAPQAKSEDLRDVLRDRRLWGVAAANALVMSLYALWANWTTVYFVEERGLTTAEANQYFAWIPPVFATLGGFFGGWLAFRLLATATDATRVRVRICWTIAPVLLLTAFVPMVPSAPLAAGAMAVSFFACLAIVNNLQMIPVSLFGARRAAFTGSVLSCSFALMQAVISPIIGSLVDNYGFPVVCLIMSVLPLAGVVLLGWATKPIAMPVPQSASV